MILWEGKGQTLGDVCIPGTGIEKGGNASGKDVREGTRQRLKKGEPLQSILVVEEAVWVGREPRH